MTEKPVDSPEETGPPAAKPAAASTASSAALPASSDKSSVSPAPPASPASPPGVAADASARHAAAYGAAAWTQPHPEKGGAPDAAPPHASAASPEASFEETVSPAPEQNPAYGAAAWTQPHAEKGGAPDAAPPHASAASPEASFEETVSPAPQRDPAYGAAAWTQPHPEQGGAPDAMPPHASAASPEASFGGAVSPAPQRDPAYGAAAWTQSHPETGAVSNAASSGQTQNVTPPGHESAEPPVAGTTTPPRYEKRSESAWTVMGRIVNARARSAFDRAGQRLTQRTLKIGVSARIFHPEPGAKGLRGKTLQYLEESISHWVMSRDVLVFMVPTVVQSGMLHPSNIRLRDYAKHLDALVLQGGADVSPQSFAGSPDSPVTQPEWPGDRVRDMYELELLHEFIESGKPVLGICRGCQLINVAFGGTLYQDIATDVPSAGIHVNDQYDRLNHAIRFPADSTLMGMFGGREHALVNSIHHQAVSQLGRDLRIEAVSEGDGIVEAIRYRKAPFVVGVQWHPEFHHPDGTGLLDCSPLLDHFLRAARETRL